jgi:hypothetical protein
MRNLFLPALVLASSCLIATSAGRAQNAATPPVPNEISADMGTCSAQISVTGTDLKPVYGAKVTTRIQYGLLGVKRLDLEGYTGPNGRVKITNLPEVLKKPMYIHISKNDEDHVVEFKPSWHCQAEFDVELRQASK